METVFVSRCTASNFMGLSEFVALLDGPVTEISGPNRAGKSSAILGLISTLQGARQRPERMLKEGEDRGFYEVELSDGSVITLRVKPGSVTLNGKGPDGDKLNQTAMNKILGPVGMDITALLTMDGKGLRKVAADLAGEEYLEAVAKLDGEVKAAETERTLVNRELAKLGAATRIEAVERVDVGEVSKELQEAEAHNREQDRLEAEKAKAESLAEAQAAEVKRLEAELEQARKAEATLDAAAMNTPPGQGHVVTSHLHERLTEAGKVNAQADAFDAYKAGLKARTEKTAETLELDKRVGELRAARVKLDKDAAIPVPGLRITKDGIRVNGIPAEQLSTEESISLCADIALALKPALRFCIIRRGNDLDRASFAKLPGIAKAKDCRFLVETCGIGHGGDTIKIIEGETVEADDPRWLEFVKDETEMPEGGF